MKQAVLNRKTPQHKEQSSLGCTQQTCTFINPVTVSQCLFHFILPSSHWWSLTCIWSCWSLYVMVLTQSVYACLFFFFFNFIKESFELLILCSLSPPLPLLLLPFLVYVSCLFRTDNRIILKILLLVLQKQSIRIQNREKSILDLLYFCKKKKEPKLICVLHQTAQTTSN